MTTPIDKYYQEISIEQIRKENFNHAHYHCMTHCHRRKDSTPSSEYISMNKNKL